jgi:mercuric ion binding protein
MMISTTSRRTMSFCVLAFALAFGMGERSAEATALTVTEAKKAAVVLQIEGMACEGCAKNAEHALRKLDGVHDVALAFEKQTAKVTYDPTRATTKQMIEALASVGYEATLAPSR